MKHGYKQTLDTLIYEETLLLAKYLRNGRKEWIPRFAKVDLIFWAGISDLGVC